MRNTIFTLASLSAAMAFAQSERPNIMLIVVDDLGFSDLGCYGGEINTPNIDALANNGLRFTQFYNGSRSCPSRASLLTGLYPHQAGITGMGQSINNKCVTIPEVLKPAGYSTAMTGKWHLSQTQARSSHAEQMQWLANRVDYGPFAPLASYPCNRGFDEHYGIIWGVANFFDPFSLVHNEERIASVPDDFYLTDFVTDKSVMLIDSLSKVDKPFFMYVAHPAPHWPLHAKPEDIAKYKGKYDAGWDVIQRQRYDKMVELGLIDPAKVPYPRNESGRSWSAEPNKAWEAAHMEVHAAMIDCVDQGIGEIIDKLKETGEYDNTIIFFLSDNGASSERYADPGFDRPSLMRNGETILYPAAKAMPGTQNVYGYIGNGWAGAINTPFRYWKSESFHGGNATPFIIHWPAGLKTQPGEIIHKPGHVIDMMPTCIELANATYPTTYKGVTITPAESNGIKAIIDGEAFNRTEPMFWEHEGGRAVRLGDWKLVSLKNANWQLFDLANDLSETRNVAVEYPDKVKELKALWNTWARKMGLNVTDDIPDTPVDLAFYYSFDSNLTDGAANKYSLTAPNGNSFAAGRYSDALQLNGSNQYLDLNTANIVNPGNTQYTICAWVYNTATTVPSAGNLYEEVILAQKDGSSDAAGRIALYTRFDGATSYFNNFLGNAQNLSSPNAFKRNEWMHVAVVCNPATREVTYYINGVRDVTCYAANAFENSTGGFRIGAHKASRNYWNGKIDELYMFKGLLSGADIVKVMNNTYFVTEVDKVSLDDYSLNAYYDNNVIKTVGLNPVKRIELYDGSGRLMKTNRDSSQMNVNNLVSGRYILRLEDVVGNKRSKSLMIR